MLAKPEDFCYVSEYIDTGKTEKLDLGIDLTNTKNIGNKNTKTIKSSGDARKMFYEERNEKYDKTKYAK